MLKEEPLFGTMNLKNYGLPKDLFVEMDAERNRKYGFQSIFQSSILKPLKSANGS